MDSQILAGEIARAANPADYRIVGEVLSVEPIAIMLRKDDPAFKQAVDDSLRRDDEVGRDGPPVRQVVHAADAAARTRPWACRPATPRGPPGRGRTTRRSRTTFPQAR